MAALRFELIELEVGTDFTPIPGTMAKDKLWPNMILTTSGLKKMLEFFLTPDQGESN